MIRSSWHLFYFTVMKHFFHDEWNFIIMKLNWIIFFTFFVKNVTEIVMYHKMFLFQKHCIPNGKLLCKKISARSY